MQHNTNTGNQQRAVSVKQLLSKKFKTLAFTGEYEAAIGTPEASGVWILWGHSGNGKTRFSLQLGRYLANFGRVVYNTLEEGARRSFQKAIEECNMQEVGSRFKILDREPVEALKQRLRKRQSPDFIIIDSFQYSQLTRPEYISLKQEFSNKLFVFVSHAEGNNPSGRTARFVRYDADVKIRIEGYRAFPVSRYGGGKPYTIWHQGAESYWGSMEHKLNKDTDHEND